MATMNERPVAVVTGASAGVGRAAAKALAAQGWHVIAHGRHPGRLAEAEAEIRAAAAPGARVDMLAADLALLADAARLADAIAGLTDRVDVLAANAGGVRSQREITAEGHEATFTGNHLSHFLLTRKLMPLLRATARGRPEGTVRIISTSSTGHESVSAIDWDDLQMKEGWISGRAYCLTKLANVLFTRELARRLAPDGIVANALHPGVIGSNFASHATSEMRSYMETLDLLPPEAGADTLIWLATAPEAGEISGQYCYQRQVVPASPLAGDAAAALRLWEESERLVAGY